MDINHTRIDKFLANSGISARRNISEVLKTHTVTINGKRVKEAGVRFDPNKDILLLDGKEIPAPSATYIIGVLKFSLPLHFLYIYFHYHKFSF